MRPTPNKNGLLRLLIAIAFVAIQTVALAHEIKHDLRQHDNACALHFCAEHLGKTPVSALFVLPTLAPGEAPAPNDSLAACTPSPLGYHTRAPPLYSEA